MVWVLKLKLSEIIVDRELQARVTMNEETTLEYQRLYEEGVALPELEAVEDSEGKIWMWEGFHRHAGATLAGLEMLPVRVRPGTRDDALWLSLSANTTHGLQRSNDDKRKAVLAALTLRPEMGDREIARHCSVSHTTVARLRLEMQPADDEPVGVGHGLEEDEIPFEMPDRSEATSSWEEDDEADEPAVRDKSNSALPEKIVPAFRAVPSIHALCGAIEELVEELGRIKEQPGGELLMATQIQQQLRSAKNTIWASRPYRPCPSCKGLQKFCGPCKNHGWVSKIHWDHLTEKEKE